VIGRVRTSNKTLILYDFWLAQPFFQEVQSNLTRGRTAAASKALIRKALVGIAYSASGRQNIASIPGTAVNNCRDERYSRVVGSEGILARKPVSNRVQ